MTDTIAMKFDEFLLNCFLHQFEENTWFARNIGLCGNFSYYLDEHYPEQFDVDTYSWVPNFIDKNGGDSLRWEGYGCTCLYPGNFYFQEESRVSWIKEYLKRRGLIAP